MGIFCEIFSKFNVLYVHNSIFVLFNHVDLNVCNQTVDKDIKGTIGRCIIS